MQQHPIIAGLVSLALLAVVALGAFLAARWHAQHPHALAPRARALWRHLGQGWSAHVYLTAHLVVGLGVALLALWCFVALADAVSDRAAITQFDVTVDDALHARATPSGIMVARLLSDIGSPIAMTMLMIVVAIILWVRDERLLFTTWLAAFIGGSVLDQALKLLFHRSRPTFQTPIIVAHGFSFPSGHAMGSLIGFGVLAYLMIRLTRRESLRVTIIGAAIVLVIGIGFSRLYLGVHFFSDVVAGYAAGIVWLVACLSGAEVTTAERRAHAIPATVIRA